MWPPKACHERFSLENLAPGESARICRADGHFETKALESAYERPLELLGVSAVEVIGAKIAIGLLILEHVKYDYQDGMGHSNDGTLLSFASG